MRAVHRLLARKQHDFFFISDGFRFSINRVYLQPANPGSEVYVVSLPCIRLIKPFWGQTADPTRRIVDGLYCYDIDSNLWLGSMGSLDADWVEQSSAASPLPHPRTRKCTRIRSY